MAQYLSDDWFTAVAEAIGHVVVVDTRVTIQQTVTDGPDGDVTWVVDIDEHGIHLTRGAAAEPSASFTQTYATAAAVASGERRAQAALMAGDITLAGDGGALLAAAGALARIGDALAAVRASTTY